MTNTGGIGFHLGSGGNKTGLGEWIASLNSAKISIFLKSSDSYGEIWEAIQSGNVSNVENLVIYRLTQEDQNPANDPLGVQNVPDYTLPPSIAAKNHCDAILIALEKTPEFDKQKTWLDMINEPRTKKAPGDIQYMDMNAMDWLGECCYEIALYMNDKGFRVALPSINSGEPGIDMQDAVIQYSQPGFLRYLDYCAKNPSIAMVTVHEYVWDKYLTDETFEDWYPHLFGRCEAMIAAADLAGIPRAFGIAMTEWGFAATHAPEWEQAKPHIVDYTAWMSRFSQVKGVASWTLQGGKDWGNVSDAIQTWITPLINYTKNERPSIVEQPQKTHELFGGTLPNGDSVMALKAKYNLNWELPRENPEEVVKLRAVQQKKIDGNWQTVKSNIVGIEIEHEAGVDIRFVVSQMVEEDEILPPIEPPEFAFTHWPTDYKFVTQEFGANPHVYEQYGLPGHDGTDIRAFHNTPLYAVASGIVSDVHTNPDDHNYGIFIRVDHGDGWETTYAHAKQLTDLQVGNSVDGGEILAWADNTGNSNGSHLHLTLKRKGFTYVDGNGESWPYNIHDSDVYLRGFDNVTWPSEPEPPTGETHNTDFMRADPTAWRVVKRADGSGEDVWELRLSDIEDCRVKNTAQGEWYEYRTDGVYRLRDTSPAPDSKGNDRLYQQHTNGVLGGQIAPIEAEIGKVYEYFSDVQFKRKSDCADLAENSGDNARSTFLLKEIIDNHTFSTDVTVDKLWVTVQTGEVQLYAEKDGRKLGWVGGGSSQDGNTWSAELSEIYFDRQIPQNEPDKYCS